MAFVLKKRGPLELLSDPGLKNRTIELKEVRTITISPEGSSSITAQSSASNYTPCRRCKQTGYDWLFGVSEPCDFCNGAGWAPGPKPRPY